MLAGQGPWRRGGPGTQAPGAQRGGVCEGLTKLQSYSWRRLAELRGRGWSRDRPRRFRPWEAPAPPRPAPPSAADPGSRRVALGLRSQAVGPDTGLFAGSGGLGRVLFENTDSGGGVSACVQTPALPLPSSVDKLPNLCLSFPVFKRGVRVPTFLGGCKD